jgi:hypothetical protein
MRKRLMSWTGACCLSLGACTTLPYLVEATGGIPARDVVLRIKCELSDAFEAADHTNWLLNQGKFSWLKNWTAQVDLTLQVLNTATLAPGATITTPLHNGYNPAVGPSSLGGTTIPAISQNLMVAAGVSLNGQAQRTETMSFALSLAELERWRESENTKEICAISDNTGLEGRLGLKEWIAEALSPVARENESIPEYLWAGYHPKPGSAGATPKPSQPKQVTPAERGGAVPCDPSKYDDNLDEATKALTTASDLLSQAAIAARDAQALAQSTNTKLEKFESSQKMFNEFKINNMTFNAVLDPDIRNTEDKIAYVFNSSEKLHVAVRQDLKDGQAQYEVYAAAAARASIQIPIATAITGATKPDYPSSACEARKQALAALSSSKDALDAANKAKSDAQAAEHDMNSLNLYASDAERAVSTLQTVDPPISNIGQSVQFILAYGGNITPTWTFVRFKGPNNPLFATAGTRTHMLNITLGPIQPGTTKSPSAGVTTNQLYLLLNNLLPTVAR